MRLGSYRYKPSKPVGIANIVIAIGLLVVGIVMTTRKHGGDRLFLFVWIGIVLVIIAQFVWVTFSKKGSTGILMPTNDDDR